MEYTRLSRVERRAPQRVLQALQRLRPWLRPLARAWLACRRTFRVWHTGRQAVPALVYIRATRRCSS
ncbi:MAG: hypothetical protein AB7N91_04535 [Candidatus Tectimicrobiota bacterium]